MLCPYKGERVYFASLSTGSTPPLRFCGGGRGATPFLARGRSPFLPGLGISGPAKWLQGGPWRRSWPQALAWSLRPVAGRGYTGKRQGRFSKLTHYQKFPRFG